LEHENEPLEEASNEKESDLITVLDRIQSKLDQLHAFFQDSPQVKNDLQSK